MRYSSFCSLGLESMAGNSLQGPNPVAHVCKWCLIAVGLNLALLHPASAASCLANVDRSPQLELQMFAEDPSRVLRYAQNDDNKLEAKVTSYVASDPELLSVIRELVLETPTSHRVAVGKALARAALHCASVEPALVRKFSSYVNALRDSNVLAGYTSLDSAQGLKLGTIGRTGSSGSGRSDLMVGEFGTEIADPFSQIPLPQ